VFALSMKLQYGEEYLRTPDTLDLKRIVKLHKEERHGVNRMFGSLNCMHTPWRNCQKGWQASSISGKETVLTVVLKASSDYHLWFWHASFDIMLGC
jgi:hypothetical protein